MSNLKQWLTAGAAICMLSVAGRSQAQVVHEETKSGQASSTFTVTTSTRLTGKNGQLYLAAVSTRPKLVVTAVSGLGLNWAPVKAQCSGRDLTGVEVWMAQGTSTGNGTVTATLAGTASNVIIAVSRYSGVHATSPIGNVISGNTTGSPGTCEGGVDSATYSFKLTTKSNNALIYGVATMRTKFHTPGTGYTEQLDIQQGTGKNTVSIAVQDKLVASAARVAIDGSFSGDVDWAVVAMEIRPSSAVGSMKYKLTSNTVGLGSVSLNPSGGTYEAGTVVTLTAKPAAGSKFNGWSGDLNSPDNPATILMNANKIVTANFKSSPYKLTVNILGSGSVTLDPPGGSYVAGTVVTLKAIPSPGFQFSGWEGDLAGSINPSTITAINANQSVTAIFTGNIAYGEIIHKETQAGVASNSATVNTSANLAGVKDQLYLAAISTRPKVGVTKVSGLGLNWTLVKAQCSGRDLSGVEIWMAQATPGGGSSIGNGVVTATLSGVASNAIIIVSRYFGVHTTSPLGNVTSRNTTGVTGSCTGGVDSGVYSLNLTTKSEGAVVYGATTMRAQPHTSGTGYREWADFQHGSGSNVVSLAVEEKKVASASTVTVDGSFEAETDWAAVAVEIRPLSASGSTKFTLTNSSVGSGSVSLNPSGGTYDAGTVVTLTATPAAGFEFSHWSGDLNGSDNPATITINVNKQVTANFKPLFYKLTVNNIGSGNVTLNPPEGPYAAGSVVTLTATPSAGFQFSFWGGALTGSTNPATFTIGTADKSIKAVFKESNASGQIVHAETGAGVASNSTTVATSGNLAGVKDQLYLASISTRPKVRVTKVSGLGLNWMLVKAQCSGRDLSGVEVWMAQGNSTGTGAVTATLASVASNAIIVASRYSGMQSTNPVGNVTSGNTSGATGSCTGGVDIGAYSLNLATSANNAIVYSAVTMRSQTHMPGAGYTEWAEFQQGSGGSIVSLALQEKSIASASTITVDGSFNGNVDWAAVAVEIRPRVSVKYTLTTKTVGSGSVSINPSGGTYDAGTVVTLTATPAAGFVFSHWSGDLNGSDNPATIAMNANKNVTAHFTPLSYKLMVNILGTGSVSLNPPGDTYPAGTMVTLTATPVAGFEFSHWSGDLDSSDNPATITMDANKDVTANFSPLSYKLTVNTLGSGSVSLNPLRDTYEVGAKVTLMAVPVAGFEFSHWSGDLNSSDNPVTITMDVNKNVTANFTPLSYKLTVNTLGSGSVVLNPPGGTYPAGTVVTLAATPSAGFQFSFWGDALTGSINPATFTIGTADKSVKAVFMENNASGQIIHAETRVGVAGNSATVKTSANLLGVKDQLYLAAISTRPRMVVTSVFGLGLNWTLVKAQCSGQDLSGVEVWMAQGSTTGNGVVTATLADTASNAIIAVSRYLGMHATNSLGNLISGNTTGATGFCTGGVDSDGYSLNLATSVNNAIVYSAATMRSQTHTPGAGYTEWAEFQQGSGGNIVSLALQEKSVASASTVAVEGSFDGNVDWAAVAVEIKPRPNIVMNTNLAKNKPVIASKSDLSNPPANAVDANGNTYWRSSEVSASAPLAWLRVNLGAALAIGRAVLKWSGNYYAKAYDLQISNDEANWTTVYSSTSTTRIQDFTFPPTTAQYVRLYLKDYNLTEYRLLELQIYPPARAMSKSSNEDIAETANPDVRLPEKFVLQQNYPNPFSTPERVTFGNPSTRICFALPEAGKVTVHLYSQTGQLVRTLVDGEMPAGAHSVYWNGRSLLGNTVAAGVYLYRITVTGKNGDLVFSQTQRMTMVK